MSAQRLASALIPLAALPPVRGRLTAEAPVGRHTWFGVGGNAEFLFQPADRDDLAAFLSALEPSIPVMVIGGGANILVRDGGIAGVTIRLNRGFSGLAAGEDGLVAGAGVLQLNAGLFAAEAGIGGLEFLSGIPGTIGGGLRMNAGAYGREIKDALISAIALDRAGREHMLAAPAIGFSYRHCGVNPDWIFVEGRFRGETGNPDAVAHRMAEIRARREETQPIRARTGGSTFKNPPGHSAWRLIEAAGCRGLQRGGAMISPKHANFLINIGDATAADLEGLGEEVRRRVYDTTGIMLEWEIRRIGRPLPGFVPVPDSATESWE